MLWMTYDTLTKNQELICKRNQWEFLIRNKDGSIPTLAQEYGVISEMGEGEEEIVEME